MFDQRIQKPMTQKGNKCKITIKRKKDGSIEKSISGECTPAQLKALSENNDFGEMEEQEMS